jgi:TorA maturation chaperone TorD
MIAETSADPIHLGKVADEYRTLALTFYAGELEDERRRIFGHTLAADCPPVETQWGGAQTFQQAQDLADIAGFYRAWGLRPAAGGERLDHIATELEFAGYLAWKEAGALALADEERAGIARAARRRFIEEHLGRWAHFFALRLEVLADGGPFAEVARAIGHVVEMDARELGARTADEPLAPVPPPFPAEGSTFECGAGGCAAACPGGGAS